METDRATSSVGGPVVWMTPHIVGIALAFAAGGGVGWFAARGNVPVAAPEGRTAGFETPQAAPRAAGGAGGTEIPGEHGPQAHVEAGIDAMANGNYREASRHLEIAANEGIDAPPLAILRAIAAEGAGEPDLAARFVTGDTERILLRDVAKRAFMENADVAIAGPAYQLYLRLTPNDGRDANRAMMERAVEVWKSPPAPAAP